MEPKICWNAFMVECAIVGAWDYIYSHYHSQLMEKLVLSFEKGNFLTNCMGNLHMFCRALKKAIAMKYANHLS